MSCDCAIADDGALILRSPDCRREHDPEDIRAEKRRAIPMPSDPVSLKALIDKLRRVAKCIYIAVEKPTADDVSATCLAAAAELEAHVPSPVSSTGAEQENLGRDTPWPLSEVLNRLANAADHLLNDHDCDTHGWEGITVARDKAREYAAALRDSSPRTGSEGWQPIETAPHTIHVLVMFPSSLVAIAYLTEPCPPMVQTWRWAVGPGTGTQLCGWPTHWMPLPSPPAGSARETK